MANAAALESATIDSITGSIIHDIVDYIQERILKDRQSRSEEHCRILEVGCVFENVQSIPHFDYLLSLSQSIFLGILGDLQRSKCNDGSSNCSSANVQNPFDGLRRTWVRRG
jgi:hypothetical protein